MKQNSSNYGFIYITTNILNGKMYIGKRVYDKRGEWKTYLGSGVLIKKAIKKYGKNNFDRKIIDYAKSLEELNEKERFWINHYGAIKSDMFYNIASGGDGGNVRAGYSYDQYIQSENKRVAAVINGHACGERIKNSRLTESDVMEIIARIKNNESLADIGRDYGVSEMTICDIKHKRTWKHLTKQEDFSSHHRTYTGNNCKQVRQFDYDMNLIATYRSAREAENKTGIGYRLISRVCCGDRPSTHGFIFKFSEGLCNG